MITLIANPSSRSGRGKKLWPAWRETLEGSHIPFHLLETASREDCEAKARAAKGLATAVGGDGTINAVVSSLLRIARTDNGRPASTPRLGVLYSGTSPDFCRFHHIPVEPDQAMRTLLAGHTRTVDVVSIKLHAQSDSNTQNFFTCSCNIGLGAATAAFANTYRRYLGDGFGTGLGLIRAMLTHRTFTCQLALDGGASLEFPHTNHVLLLKNPFIASGLRLNLPLSPDDGLMYAVVIHGYSRPRLLTLLRRLYNGNWMDVPGVFIQQCRSAVVTTRPCQEVEYDGDPMGRTPVQAAILPRALSLICAPGQGDRHE